MELAGSRRSRWGVVLIACLTVGFSFGVLTATAPSVAWAQEGEPKKEEPATQEEPDNLFTYFIKSAGWFFGPLLFVVSILLVTLIVLLAMDMRMGVAVPPAFVDDFTELVNKRQFKQAFDLCRNDNSYLARVLTAGMSRLQYGIDDARESALNMVESVKAGKEQLINYMATIGTLGPMLGLVGTVFGMIMSFRILATKDSPPVKDLASGISHALVVTLMGVALSVPAIFCHAFFRNRLIRIAMDTSNLADDLLTQMYHNSKKTAGAAATATEPRSTAVQG